MITDAAATRRARLRDGGLAGLAGNLLMIGSVPLAPPWPPFSASAEVVAAYVRDHGNALVLQAWIAALGVIPLVAFAGALAGLLRERGAEVAGTLVLGAMLAFVAAFGINWTPWVILAMRPDRDLDTIVALYDLGLVGQFVGVGASLAWLFVAVLWAAIVRAIPRPFAVPAAIAIPLNVALAGATDREGLLSPSGPVGMGSIPVFGLTLTACSIWMLVAWRREARAAQASVASGAERSAPS